MSENKRPCEEENDCKPVKCINCPELWRCNDPKEYEGAEWREFRQGWRKS